MDLSPAIDMADALLAVQMEKLRVEEALAARDSVVAHLEDAYISVRQKVATISRLEQELEVFKRASTPANTNSSSFDVMKAPETPRSDPGQTHEYSQKDMGQRHPVLSESPCTPDRLSDSLQSNSAYCRQFFTNTSALVRDPYIPTNSILANDEEDQVSLAIPEGTMAEQAIAARQETLATLPLPSGIPDDALQPIMIHPPHTLHEFLGNATGILQRLHQYSGRLKNYRVLSQPMTYWCPDREEHGYFLTPVFKCTTNPRVTTAHRWSAVDVIGQMSNHTECFYNRDGKWYYAGTYKAFRMDDLTVQEWGALSTETTQAIIKETLAGRKNVSPQNHYEASQLYAAGALRVACVGLHCVGFSDDLYRGVLEQAKYVYWSRSSTWAPVKPTIARSERGDDDKYTLP